MFIEKYILHIIDTEKVPSHFHHTWNNESPIEIKSKWLNKFIKKNLSKEDFIEFIQTNYEYHKSIEDFKKSKHYFIMKNSLEMDWDKYNWFFQNNLYKGIEFNRDFKIWQLTKNV